MTDDPISRKLREISWRRELTPSEQAELDAWLQAHPESREDWEAEMALSGSFGRLPQVPVSSNFTSRVLQAVEREALAEKPGRTAPGWWQILAARTRWVTGGAFAAVLLTTGLMVHHQHVAVRQQELVKTLEIVGRVPALPNTEVLTNFEAIRLLSQGPQPDDQLLALLQ